MRHVAPFITALLLLSLRPCAASPVQSFLRHIPATGTPSTSIDLGAPFITRSVTPLDIGSDRTRRFEVQSWLSDLDAANPASIAGLISTDLAIQLATRVGQFSPSDQGNASLDAPPWNWYGLHSFDLTPNPDYTDPVRLSITSSAGPGTGPNFSYLLDTPNIPLTGSDWFGQGIHVQVLNTPQPHACVVMCIGAACLLKRRFPRVL